MNWFGFALLTMLAWGGADLFYKKGADSGDKYSHLKTVIAVGAVMGIHAVITLITSGIEYHFINIIRYLPVSLMYIISMAVGYYGLRYLELSISSPVQNTSGAVVCLLCFVFLDQAMDWPVLAAVAVICVMLFALGVIEKRESDKMLEKGEKKYRIGFVAFFIPIIYCIIDALGTFFDAYYLDDDATATPLVGVTEDTLETVANSSYELTFLIAAVIIAFYLFVIKRERPAPGKMTADRFIAAVLETAGQFTYVYAMSSNAIVAAPMVAAYSIVSLLLSGWILKEKLSVSQYICISFVIIGIIVIGVYDI